MRILLLVCVMGFCLVLPDMVEAQGSLVTCSGPDCTVCHVVSTANGLIGWLVSFMVMLATAAFVFAGFQMLTAAGDESQLSNAKKIFTDAIVGLLLVLGAWLIVDTVMKRLVSTGGVEGRTALGPWNQIQCNPQLDGNTFYAFEGEDDLVGSVSGDVLSKVDVAAQPDGQICFGDPAAPTCVEAFSGIAGSGNYVYADGSGRGYEVPGKFIDITQIDPNTEVAPGLTICEVTNCNESQRSGNYVHLDPEAIARLGQVNGDLGGDLSVNSGYRSPTYNSGVGGAHHSRHQYGDAFDIAITPSNSASQIIASCKTRGATFTKVYGSWVHCDWR